MAEKVRHLLPRDGRYYARIVIPKALRPFFDKGEMQAPLGADRREALRRLPAAVAEMQSQIEAARQQAKTAYKPKAQPTPGKPLNLRQAAQTHYARQLEKDTAARMALSSGIIRDLDLAEDTRPYYEKALRRVTSRKASDDEIAAVIQWAIDELRQDGHTAVEQGTPEWRELAYTLADVQLATFKKINERNTGLFDDTPEHPALLPPKAPSTDPLAARMMDADAAKPLSEVFVQYSKERDATPATMKECEVAIRMFEEFLETPKPTYRLVRADLMSFKRALAETPSNYTKRFPGLSLPKAIVANKKRKTPFEPLTARTINNKYLSRLHSILGWCVKNDIIPDNPATGVKVDSVKKDNGKRKYFSADELSLIFPPDMFGKPFDEFEWAMLCSLYGGMRASELAQVRLSDIRKERGILIFSIEQRTKNTNSKRMVPVHPKLRELGLLDRIAKLEQEGSTHLFPDWYRKGMKAKQLAAENGVGDHLNEYFPRFIPKRFIQTYLPKVGVTDGSPIWHTFRHTFKTNLSMAGVAKPVRDYLCGHADDSAGAVYVHDISIEVMQEAVGKLTFSSIQARSIDRTVITIEG